MKNIFVPKVDLARRTQIRNYLAFMSESGTKHRKYYINQDGQIIEYDSEDFIRNKKMANRALQSFMFFKDHEYLIRQGWIYVSFDHELDYLQVQVWKETMTYMAMALKVLRKMADKLNRTTIELMTVTEFNRNQPVGDVETIKADKLKRLIDRVAWL